MAVTSSRSTSAIATGWRRSRFTTKFPACRGRVKLVAAEFLRDDETARRAAGSGAGSAAGAVRQRLGARAGRQMDAGPARRTSRARPHDQRRDAAEAPQSRGDVAAPADSGGACREILDLRIAVVSARPQGAGAHDPAARRDARARGAPFPRRARAVGSDRPRAAAGTTDEPVREASPHGRPHDRGMDALPPHTRPPPRAADSRAGRDLGMSSKRDKDKLVIRVPNPDAPVKERLKTPAHKVHRSKKGYRRREKQQKAGDPDNNS